MSTRAALVAGLLLALTCSARPQTQSVFARDGELRRDESAITSPLQQFGASIGDDYFLATHAQFEQYWARLDVESDRVQVVSIGPTEEGRRQLMAIVSSPENLARLERYRDISRRLALAEGISDEEAERLAEDGKAIVLIAGGLHADEVLGVQQLIETVYQLASRSDPETLRILRDVIVLAVHANPDGHALAGDWYMAEPDPRRRTLSGVPRPYHKYAGHDNNRDFYISNLAETININRVMTREWFPQIVYDHHQAAPPGTVMFAPPFGGPFNRLFDPLIPPLVELLGAAIHARFAAEGKAGVTTREGGPYSTWWNGALRTTAYFHNQVGLLTETIGSPTPVTIPLVPSRQVAGPDLPLPIQPQPWRFRQSIDYSVAANRAVLDAASQYRETWLLNAYRMARSSIARGRTEEPYGYIVPADQPDFLTATRFVDALLKSGVMVHRAARSFAADARTYPQGSYVVLTAQAFRPHVLDMFEPQAHGSELSAAYDITGWTLAYQMGIRFDRVRAAFDGPFERVDSVAVPRGAITGPARPAGYLLNHHQNDVFRVVNRLLRAAIPVYWLQDRTVGGHDGTGSMFIPATAASTRILRNAADDAGVSPAGVAAEPAGAALRVRPVRLGLWDQDGGASTSGWIRWILERYEFAHERVDVDALLAANLDGRYDVIILPDEAGRDARRAAAALKEFVTAGGTLVSIGDATAIADDLGIAVTNRVASLPADEFDIPGTVLRVAVDNSVPIAYGFERQVDMMFDSSPAFDVVADARGTQRVAWFAGAASLRSGWARGEHHLAGAAAVVEARVGKGRVVLVGPEIAFRAQPHGTFKFLFNAIHAARAEPVIRIPAVPAQASARR